MILVESLSEPIKTIAELSGIRPHLLYRHYKQVSGFYQWDQRDHAAEYLVFEKNIGSRLSIDEVSLTVKGHEYSPPKSISIPHPGANSIPQAGSIVFPTFTSGMMR